MITKSEIQVDCDGCGSRITLRTYFGLEGGFFTDHHVHQRTKEEISRFGGDSDC